MANRRRTKRVGKREYKDVEKVEEKEVEEVEDLRGRRSGRIQS